MVENWLSRTELLLGDEKLKKLRQAHILVVGLGGVGAYAAEQLVRAGIGNMTIVDGDTVHPSNRNRQIAALVSTDGQEKAGVVANRLKDINPELNLTVISEFIKDERIPQILDALTYDFVVDAIDTLSPKVFLIVETFNRGLPLISSMGAGGKFDPSKIEITDISKTHNCKLARMIRKRLTKHNIKKGFTVVFSPETVKKEHVVEVTGEQNKKTTVGTISYMPGLFGMFAASHVIRTIADI